MRKNILEAWMKTHWTIAGPFLPLKLPQSWKCFMATLNWSSLADNQNFRFFTCWHLEIRPLGLNKPPRCWRNYFHVSQHFSKIKGLGIMGEIKTRKMNFLPYEGTSRSSASLEKWNKMLTTFVPKDGDMGNSHLVVKTQRWTTYSDNYQDEGCCYKNECGSRECPV